MKFRSNIFLAASLVVLRVGNVAAADDAGGKTVTNLNPAIEKEYEQLQAMDDAAGAEAEKWIRESRGSNTNVPAARDSELKQRIKKRMEPVRQAYEDFLGRHPRHVSARLTYGSFLNDQGDEAGAQVQWEKALELDPNNPDAYNNLAGRYSEIGPAEKAFQYYDKAIKLNPSSALYYYNLGDTTYVLRKKAMEYYHQTEQQVYARALGLYSNAARLDQTNFIYGSKMAETFYTLQPFPADGALQAWTNVLRLARDEEQRGEVFIHFARAKMLAGRYAEARAQLEAVTNAGCLKLKSNLIEAIALREKEKR